MYIITYYKENKLVFRAERGILETYQTIKRLGKVYKIFGREDGITGKEFLANYNSLTEPMLLVMTTLIPDEDQQDFEVIENSIIERMETIPVLREKDILFVANSRDGLTKEEFLLIYGDRVMRLLEKQIMLASQQMISLDRDMVLIKKDSDVILKGIREKVKDKKQRECARA